MKMNFADGTSIEFDTIDQLLAYQNAKKADNNAKGTTYNTGKKPSVIDTRISEYMALSELTLATIIRQSFEIDFLEPYGFKKYSFLKRLCDGMITKETIAKISDRDVYLNARDNLREFRDKGTVYRILYGYGQKSLVSTVKA